MKNLCIIRAEMSSSRLPGKPIMQHLNKTMVEIMHTRVGLSQKINQTVWATSLESSDNILVKEFERLGITFFRGSVNNVLQHLYLCAKKYKPQNVVHLTVNCPLIDWQVIDKTIQHFEENGSLYTCNNKKGNKYPPGMNVEVFSYNLLEKAYLNAQNKVNEDDPTTYIENLAQKQAGASYLSAEKSYNNAGLQLNTEEDLELITFLLEKLHPSHGILFSFEDIQSILQKGQ